MNSRRPTVSVLRAAATASAPTGRPIRKRVLFGLATLAVAGGLGAVAGWFIGTAVAVQGADWGGAITGGMGAVFVGALLVATVERMRRSAEASRPMAPHPSERVPVILPQISARSDHWSAAIAAAETGDRAVALEMFRVAIEQNPDYYLSTVLPASALARECWSEAVEHYKRAANRKARAATGATSRCSRCGKEVGVAWHYEFESIMLAALVGKQCPQCGVIVCSADQEAAPEGNTDQCLNCGVQMTMLFAGEAYSSMVDAAVRRNRYRGAIRGPSALGRPVKFG